MNDLLTAHSIRPLRGVARITVPAIYPVGIGHDVGACKMCDERSWVCDIYTGYTFGTSSHLLHLL